MAQNILLFISGMALSFLLQELRYCKPMEGDCYWRWITDDEGEHMVCSVCGEEAFCEYDGEYYRTPFCPWCGTRLKGEK